MQRRSFDRRRFLRGLGTALAVGPAFHLLGCGSSTTQDLSGDAGTDAKGDAATDALVTETDAVVSGFATGGTAAMKGGYADPFAASLGSACAVYKASTLGPCHATTVDRQDISEAQLGLPTRLALLVVDPSCNPVPGATVEIWHCSPGGLYSGSDAADMCTNKDAAARAARWFRGIRTADAKGRVDFDTCFPGWYSSRTVHIHFTVRVGGAEYVTSQLFFDDTLNDEVIGTQPIYKDRGKKDTTNAADKVINESALVDYTLQTALQSDGALLAWKALVVHG